MIIVTTLEKKVDILIFMCFIGCEINSKEIEFMGAVCCAINFGFVYGLDMPVYACSANIGVVNIYI